MDARFALLLGCFLLSGFAALLYQTAWTRELSFVFGTSELAVAAVLAAYMGGLALGAAAAARVARRLRRPVLVYGLLELAIALSALAVPIAIAGIQRAYVALLGGAPELPSGDTAALAALLQLAAAFAVLLPPTAFMGATLPLLARHAVRSEQQLGSRVGVLYAVNTAGAIAGAVCAAFLLIPELGLRRTVWVGAAANAIVFALAALLARGAPLAPEAGAEPTAAAPGGTWVLPAIALSGAVSFAYEVLWTRLLGHVLGGSLHAFATMLASFLLGIALGSALAARLATSRERARVGFGIAQLGIALTSYTVFALADRLPLLSRQLGVGPDAPLAGAALAAAALLPITLCIGATFPFAVRVLARSAEQAASATARVYAWNTVGAIAGALGAGFVLLPRLGFQGTVALGVAASALLAALAALATRPHRRALAALAAASAAALIAVPPRAPWMLLRASPLQSGERAPIAFAAVGRSSTVILVDSGQYARLFTNGLPEAGIDRAGVLPFPTSLTYWLGMLPVLARPSVHEMLVVGFGGGSALESVPSSVSAIDVVEIEPEVIAANRTLSGQRARDPLADPRVHVHIGDARGALRLTAKRYGAIVSQPSHPWTASASHLYTREFFSLVHERLQPDGVFVQWIGLRFVDEALLRSLAATLVSVFEHVEMYAPDARSVLFAASAAPLAGLDGAAQALRATPGDFARFGVHRLEDVASAWTLDEQGVRALANGAAPITDDDNRLAARAARLGGQFLDDRNARALFAHRDPLLERGTYGLDRDVLVRTLVQGGQRERANQIAKAAEGADGERAQGWAELAQNRTRSAARHFARALELAPDDPGARLGLAASRLSDLRRAPLSEVREDELTASAAALIASARHAAREEWPAVTALDAPLATFAPGDALFREAVQLRARSRLAAGGPAREEAVAILEPLLTYDWHIEDALLYATAAAAVGRYEAAWASLERIAALAPRSERGRELARRALPIADALPRELAERVRPQLARRAGDPLPEARRGVIRAR